MSAIYGDKPQLKRVQLPSGSTYAFADADLRLMAAQQWSANSQYNVGDYVIYTNPIDGLDNLYKCITPNSDAEFTVLKWREITIAEELKNIYRDLQGGVHFRGATTSALYDGSITNPITIDSASYSASNGDMVIVKYQDIATTYSTGVAYTKNTYLKNNTTYYITIEAISVLENTSIEDIAEKLNQLRGEPEYIFDGTKWNALGGIGDGLGDLAYRDSASGSYLKPTGVGSVTVKEYTTNTKSLGTTTITAVDGTVNATKVTGGTEIVYGTADVGTAVTYGNANVADSQTTVGNADVDTAVIYGTANCGEAVSGIAKVDSKKTFTVEGMVASISGDCLTFTAAGTGDVYGVKDATGVSIVPAAQSNSTLTPAKPSVTKIYGAVASNTTLTPAVAAPVNQTITGSYTLEQVTPAKAASSTITVATGALVEGNALVTDISSSNETKTVSVGTTTDTITVK